MIVLGLGLPDVDGIAVLRALRAGTVPGASRVPIIVLSARQDSDDKVEALDAAPTTT